MLEKLTFERYWLYILSSSVCMLLFAGFYDLYMGLNTCIICWVQRFFLLLISGFSGLGMIWGWSRGIVYTAVLGLLLDLRHIYVIAFPKTVTQCIPMDFLMQMPVGVIVKQLISWLMDLGRSCSEEVDLVTYLLVCVLLIYYMGIILGYRWLKNGSNA